MNFQKLKQFSKKTQAIFKKTQGKWTKNSVLRRINPHSSSTKLLKKKPVLKWLFLCSCWLFWTSLFWITFLFSFFDFWILKCYVTISQILPCFWKIQFIKTKCEYFLSDAFVLLLISVPGWDKNTPLMYESRSNALVLY